MNDHKQISKIRLVFVVSTLVGIVGLVFWSISNVGTSAYTPEAAKAVEYNLPPIIPASEVLSTLGTLVGLWIVGYYAYHSIQVYMEYKAEMIDQLEGDLRQLYIAKMAGLKDEEIALAIIGKPVTQSTSSHSPSTGSRRSIPFNVGDSQTQVEVA